MAQITQTKNIVIMTQEEKAKAYDEAIERARNLHKDAIDMGENLRAKQCEIIFPELVESEDEKIRKTLIKFHKSTIDIDGIKGGDIIAWIEKQGVKEQDARYENLEELLAADDIYQMAMNDEMLQEAKERAINALSEMCIGKLLGVKKQGEKKPIDKVEPKFKVGDTMRTLQEANDGYTDGMPVVVSIDNEYYHCTNELIAIKDQDDYEFPPINMQQKHNDKPKWNEEDDGMVACIKIHLKQCLNNYAYTRYRKWLESLKQRIGK